MGWTPEGHAKARAALLRKYGGEEGYKAELRRRAQKGGIKGGGKSGFHTMPTDKFKEASSRGGRARRVQGEDTST